MENDPYKHAVRYYDKVIGKLTANRRKLGLEMFMPDKGMRVLDVGCGTGLSLDLYKAYESSIFGIDHSQSMVAAARKKLGDTADLRVGDASELPYPGNYFDLVMTMLTLHEMPPSTRSNVFIEMIRVTKPGGHILVTDFHCGPAKSISGWLSKGLRFMFELCAGSEHFKNFRNFISNRGLDVFIETYNLSIKSSDVIDGVVATRLVSLN